MHEDDEPGNVFGEGAEGDGAAEEEANEATEAEQDGDGEDSGAAEETAEPGANRDARAEVLAVFQRLGPNDMLTIDELAAEVNTGSDADNHLPMGRISAAAEAIANEGGCKVIMLGDPPAPVYRAPDGRNRDMRRAVCIEIAGLPMGDTEETTGITPLDIAGRMSARSGGEITADLIQPVLDDLVSAGVATAKTVAVALEGAPDGMATETVDVTYYDFAPGQLFTIISGGLDALLTPAAVAARRAEEAKRAADLGKQVAALTEARDKALKASAESSAKVAEWRKRLEDRGLSAIVAELEAPAPPKAPDPRGKPFVFCERLKIDDSLAGQFFADVTTIRRKRKGLEMHIEAAKETAAGVKKDNTAEILRLEAATDELEAAHASGYYLLTTEAYRVYDPTTGRTEIRAWADNRLIKIETKADVEANVKVGTSLGLPGVDVPFKSQVDGAQPTKDAAAPDVSGPDAPAPSDGDNATPPKAPRKSRTRKPKPE